MQNMVEYRTLLFVLSSFELIHIVQSICTTRETKIVRQCLFCTSYIKATVTCKDLVELNVDVRINVPEDILASIDINIWNSDIEILPRAAFNVKKLAQLSIIHVNLTTITSGAFIAQSNVRQINLQQNKLTSISNGIFNNLRHLTALDLSDNRIQNISESAFLGTNLTTLNLSRNSIIEFGSLLQNSPNISVIDLSFNNIVRIRSCLDVSAIAKDQLGKNASCIPSNSTISELYLRNNRIESVSPLNQCIEILDIGNNRLSNLSIDLFKHASNLVELYLNGNSLKTVHNSVFITLEHLKLLDLSNNSLSNFKYGTFDGLTKLEIFNVSCNRLKLLSGAFHSLGSLKSLFLQNNDLSELNVVELLRGKSKFNQIDLNRNNWNCLALQNITIQLRLNKIHIIKGNHLNGHNVFGMSCIEYSQEEPDKIDRVTREQKLESKLHENESGNTVFYFLVLMINVNILLMFVVGYFVANFLKIRNSNQDIQLSPVIEQSI